MLRSGDWVTLHVDGVRYLEKAPLPYWLAALSLRAFGDNAFAVHLPLALTVLGLAALAWHWGRRAFDLAPEALPLRTSPVHALSPAPNPRAAHTGFYAALFCLTSTGVFLFTRIFIPDALLSLLLAFVLYAALRAIETPDNRFWAHAAWLALAAAVLTKGLVALIFAPGAVLIYLPLSGDLSRWRRLHPVSGALLFLAVAAPWHILAGIRNRGGADGHGFFWFYFVNEHVLRFLGRRSPPDYNKLPGLLFWTLHLVWLFPWSFFAPAVAIGAWQARDRLPWRDRLAATNFGARSVLLLSVFCALVLAFFSLSTNQEYYTFPVYLPLLLMTATVLRRLEDQSENNRRKTAARHPASSLLLLCNAALAAVCLLAAVALGAALWQSRKLPAPANIGDLLAHRGVGNYTLSMSHLFDLTGPSFAALRWPATLACLALALGSIASLILRLRHRHLASTLSVAAMNLVFLVAAHLAFVRFAPMLSSYDFAQAIQQLQRQGSIAPDTPVLLYGDQALGSSIPFYLGRTVELVNGRSTSMLFGSTFPDVPPLFVEPRQLQESWGTGVRKLLFVPLEHRTEVDQLLGPRKLLLYQSAGKALFTDRPLATAQAPVAMDSNSPRPEQ